MYLWQAVCGKLHEYFTMPNETECCFAFNKTNNYLKLCKNLCWVWFVFPRLLGSASHATVGKGRSHRRPNAEIFFVLPQPAQRVLRPRAVRTPLNRTIVSHPLELLGMCTASDVLIKWNNCSKASIKNHHHGWLSSETTVGDKKKRERKYYAVNNLKYSCHTSSEGTSSLHFLLTSPESLWEHLIRKSWRAVYTPGSLWRLSWDFTKQRCH